MVVAFVVLKYREDLAPAKLRRLHIRRVVYSRITLKNQVICAYLGLLNEPVGVDVLRSTNQSQHSSNDDVLVPSDIP